MALHPLHTAQTVHTLLLTVQQESDPVLHRENSHQHPSLHPSAKSATHPPTILAKDYSSQVLPSSLSQSFLSSFHSKPKTHVLTVALKESPSGTQVTYLKQLSGSGNLPSDGHVKVVDWARQRAATSKSASAGVIVRSIVLVGFVSAVG